MRRWLKRIGLLLGVLLVLLGVGLAAFVLLFDLDAYKDRVIARVEQVTGRDFTIAGALRIKPALSPTLTAGSVTLGNPGWADEKALFTADRMEVRVALRPLLDRDVVIERVALAGVALNLETHPEHGGNWRLGAGREPEARPDTGTGDGWRLRGPDHVRIEDAAISYRTPAFAAPRRLRIRRLDARVPGPEAPTTIDLRASYRERTLTAHARLDPWQRLRAAADGYRVHELDLRYGDSDLRGRGRLHARSQRPRITAQLRSELLDLRPFQDAGRAGSAGERLFSDRPMALNWLRAADAEIALQAERLRSRQASLRNLTADLTLERGRLEVRPISADVANGSLAGGFVLDAAADPPGLEVDLDLRDIRPARLPAVARHDLISGAPTDLRFAGTGRGRSPAAIASSFDGRLTLSVGQGTLRNKATDVIGADVLFSALQMINPLADREAESNLRCGVVNLDIEKGIATAEKGLALQTDKVNVLGNAVVDLATEAIAIRVKPTARRGVGISLGTLTGGFSIGGTLTDPRPTTGDLSDKFAAASRIGAAVATGGLSVIAEGVFDRTFATEDPCAVALSAPEKREGERGVLDKAKDKVGDFLDGVFGSPE